MNEDSPIYVGKTLSNETKKGYIENYIFSDEMQVSLFKIFHDLYKDFGVIYIAYMLEDNISGKRVSFYTHEEWHKLYVTENWVEICALRREIREKFNNEKGFILPWDYVINKNKK